MATLACPVAHAQNRLRPGPVYGTRSSLETREACRLLSRGATCSRKVASSHNSHALLALRRPESHRRSKTRRVEAVQSNRVAPPPATSAPPVADWNDEARAARLAGLETQALDVLKRTVAAFERPAFPCALIAGDVVLLHLLHRLDLLKEEKVKIIFIDTFHLFPETHTFLEECEQAYGFKAHKFWAAGLASKEEFNSKHGSDLFIRDIDEYDQICKVEPFQRSLEELKVDAMINGRRRDHGAERAHLEVFEVGELVKVQPLAYWEFRDCFDYLAKYNVPGHPLHASGFPSVGDVQTTLPVPREKWFEYGGERSGRFQGLKNRDGSDKTECGIHVEGEVSSSITPPSSSLTPPSSSLTPPSSSIGPTSSLSS